jgi:hypothetical protein
MGTGIEDKTLRFELVHVKKKEGTALYKGLLDMVTHTELGSFCKVSAFRRRSRGAGSHIVSLVANTLSYVAIDRRLLRRKDNTSNTIVVSY